MDDQERAANLKIALADFFGLDPDNVGAIAIACEHQDGSGKVELKTSWSGIPWHVPGMLKELEKTVKND